MPGPLTGAIRMPRPEHHRNDRDNARQCIKNADLQRRKPELLDDLRRPDAECVETGRGAEIDQRERDNPQIGEPAPDAVARGSRLFGRFSVHCGH